MLKTGRDMACGENPAGLGPRCDPSGSGFTGVGASSWVGNDGHKELREKQEGRGRGGRGAGVILIQTGHSMLLSCIDPFKGCFHPHSSSLASHSQEEQQVNQQGNGAGGLSLCLGTVCHGSGLLQP